MTLPAAPDCILENVNCGCKSATACSTRRCTCKKADLKCTGLCSCRLDCANRIDEAEVASDDEQLYEDEEEDFDEFYGDNIDDL